MPDWHGKPDKRAYFGLSHGIVSYGIVSYRDEASRGTKVDTFRYAHDRLARTVQHSNKRRVIQHANG
jgi:hypothetical protein